VPAAKADPLLLWRRAPTALPLGADEFAQSQISGHCSTGHNWLLCFHVATGARHSCRFNDMITGDSGEFQAP
jgi:hypothetical protein